MWSEVARRLFAFDHAGPTRTPSEHSTRSSTISDTTTDISWPDGEFCTPEQEQAENGASVPSADQLSIEQVNPLNAHLFADHRWHDHFERLRLEDPIHFNEIATAGRYWSVTKYDDIKTVEMDWKSFSSADGITLGLRVTPALREAGSGIVSFIAMDPPEHREQRRTVTPAVQPANLGTAPGILFPVSRIRARDPRATVAFFPSDHHISHPDPFLRARRTAVHSVRGRSALITLLGAEAERPEVEYGWIVPGAVMPETSDVPVRTVRHFVEKPEEEVAGSLCRDGALWNTFVSVGRVSTYWKLGRRHLPECTELLDAYAKRIGHPDEEPALDATYAKLSAADFSRDILERADRLGVVSVAGSGWSDWGCPERVIETLRAQGVVETLLDRVSSSVRASAMAAIPAGSRSSPGGASAADILAAIEDFCIG